MMPAPKITFIIPVYNGEVFLAYCLDSIFRQGLSEEDFEIICIDDCSQDGSTDLLQDYARLHSNIRIIRHTSNQRTGTSCNEGLDAAHGEYVWIVGQDDWILDGWANKLYSIASADQLDVVVFNYRRYTSEDTFLPSEGLAFRDTAVESGPEFIKEQFGDSFHHYLLGYEWRALFRKDFLAQYGIRFVNGAIYEDTVFLMKAIWHSRRIRSLSDVIYAYRVNTASITNRNKKYKGELAYQFAFVAGKEVLDLSKDISDSFFSPILQKKAIWYFCSFVHKVIPMKASEKKVFYRFQRDNWGKVKEMISLCPFYVQWSANPTWGPIITTILKPAFRLRKILKP